MQRYSIRPQELSHEYSQSTSLDSPSNSNARDCRSFHHCWSEDQNTSDQPLHHQHRLTDLSESALFNARTLEDSEDVPLYVGSERTVYNRRMSRPHILISQGDLNPLMPGPHLHHRHDASKYLIQVGFLMFCFLHPFTFFDAPTSFFHPFFRSDRRIFLLLHHLTGMHPPR